MLHSMHPHSDTDQWYKASSTESNDIIIIMGEQALKYTYISH